MRALAALLLLTVLATGCRQKMEEQPRYEPLEVSMFFDDLQSSRHLVPGTVARGHLRVDQHFSAGQVDGQPADTLPSQISLTEATLLHGQERFNIYCAVCHDRAGTGQGMVVLRGFPAPPSLHEPRLRDAPIGHIFDVISNGNRRMPDYRNQIPVDDRWAIAAYVKALQLSQNVPLSEAPEDVRQLLDNPRTTAP